MTALEQLREILTKPDTPIGTVSRLEWEAVESRIGLRLPNDYKHFVSFYGFGAIEDEFYILHPFARSHAIYNLENEMGRQSDVHRQSTEGAFVRPTFDGQVYTGMQPMPAGLIPWGGDQSGGLAMWDTTNADPDGWSVYVDDGSDVTRFKESMTAFLLAGLSDRSRPMVWPEWRPPVRYVAWPL